MRHGKLVAQEMVFPDNHPIFPGLPKGLHQVAKEQLGALPVRKKKHNEIVEMLSACEDFTSQHTLLQEQALARGDRVIYGVKFHPELAPIESAFK